MWSELYSGLNSDVFYYATPTNWGHLDTPDGPIDANNGATMADTGHQPTREQKGEHRCCLRVTTSHFPPSHCEHPSSHSSLFLKLYGEVNSCPASPERHLLLGRSYKATRLAVFKL